MADKDLEQRQKVRERSKKSWIEISKNVKMETNFFTDCLDNNWERKATVRKQATALGRAHLYIVKYSTFILYVEVIPKYNCLVRCLDGEKMAQIVARTEKTKRENSGGIQQHNQEKRTIIQTKISTLLVRI